MVQPFLVPFFGERAGQEARAHAGEERVPAVTRDGAGGLVEPFVVAIDHQGGNGPYIRSANEPAPTITTKARLGIAEPFLVDAGGPERAAEPRSVEQPLNTILTRQSMAVVEPFLVAAGGPQGKGRNPKSVDDPLGTVLTENHDALVQPFVVAASHGAERGATMSDRCRTVDDPMPTLTFKTRS